MRLSEIEKKAKSLGVKNTWKLSRNELIKSIQQAEGNPVCFGTAITFCDQMVCCWRHDCLK